MVTAPPPLYYRLDMGRRRQPYNINPTVPDSLGDFIRRAREAIGLSQEGFAELVGDNMSTSDVSRLELGNVGLPKPRRMIALARAIGLPVIELYVAAGYPEFRDHLGNTQFSFLDSPDLLEALVVLQQLDPEQRRSHIRLIRGDLKGPSTRQQDDRADESAASA